MKNYRTKKHVILNTIHKTKTKKREQNEETKKPLKRKTHKLRKPNKIQKKSNTQKKQPTTIEHPDEDTDELITIDNLELLLKNEDSISFNPTCLRKKANWSISSPDYIFDKLSFSPEKLLNDIPDHSPKLKSLLDKINELDNNDMKKHGHLFKHFIFSDLKNGNYGVKLLASALLAKGMKMGYSAKLNKKNNKNNKKKIQ